MNRPKAHYLRAVPEMPEVEAYCRLAEGGLGRPIVSVGAPDAWFLKRGLDATTAALALTDRSFTQARRLGKLLLLDTSPLASDEPPGPTLGLRFGMTGCLVVDGRVGVDRLLYSSDRHEEAWNRFQVTFADGGVLAVRDPRRLGGIELDPEEGSLGPDVASVGPAALRRALGSSAAPLKGRLLDQGRLAGVGNLMADEALWRAGLDPSRPAGSLSGAEVRRLHRHLRATVADLVKRGGSHTGDLLASRRPGGVCPRDGTPLARSTVAGRTTWWCPKHQR